MVAVRTLAFGLVVATTSGVLSARPKKTAPETPREVRGLTEAQQRFQRAIDLYEEGSLDAARVELQRAYDLSPNYKILYNLGQVAFELHDYPGALAFFERYLAEGGAKVPEARRSQIEKDIEKLKARVASVEIGANVASAEVFVDDAAAGATPLPKPVIVSAGRHKVVVAKSGYVTDTRWVDLAGGDAARVNVSLVEVAPTLAPAPPAPSPVVVPPARDDAWGLVSTPEPPRAAPIPWIGWTVAGSLAVGAAVTGGLAYSASRDLREERDRLGVSRAELDRQQTKVRNLALASDLSLGGSIVAAALSLWVTLSRGSAKSHGERAGVMLVPGGDTLRLEGAF